MNKLLKLLNKYDWKNYVIYYSIYGVCILLVVWFIASYINICMHNAGGDATYHYWKFNLIEILYKLLKR